MAADRVPMRKLREIVRLKLHHRLSARAIARSCGMSPSTVGGYLHRIEVAKLSWPLPPELDDDTVLEALLFPAEQAPKACRPEPDWGYVHAELQKRGVTKLLVWQEYRETHADGYAYSQFCDLYRKWARHLSATMRQVHRAGEKCFFDFSGDTIEIVDAVTGECRRAKLFVAALGASNLTYAEPVLSEDIPTWVGCHVRTFRYFGGTTAIWVPDNLKAGVKRPDNYDPEENPTYAELARHYGAVVIPTRKYKPRDKAKVEQAVLLAERWILAVLRHRTFHSMEELREAVRDLVDKLNHRPMRRLKKSRWQLFEEIERGALLPLPERTFELSEWSKPKVDLSYHVEFDDHFYSVSYLLIGERLDVRATETTVEIFQGGKRITSHTRSYLKNRYTTKNEHMPRGHQAQAEWTPERVANWARKVGPGAVAFVEGLLQRRKHPEHGFKACVGVIRLADRYTPERVERACLRAVKYRAYSYKSVAAILKHNLDRQEDAPAEDSQQSLPLHGNVRGSGYYH